MSDVWAVVSLGTNSTRVLVADFDAKRYGFFGDHAVRITLQRSVGTRLGESLGESGKLGDEPMRRTLDVVEQYVDEVRARHARRVFSIGTSALRRAQNGAEFVERVNALTSSELEILSGEDEARASFRGAVTSLDHGEEMRVGVVDTGGGSTEYAVGEHEHAKHIVSCEVGAVRLTEWFPGLSGRDGFVDNATIDGAAAKAREVLAPIVEFPRADALAFVGGSATTALSVVRGHRGPFGADALTRESLQAAFNLLCELPYEKRKNVPGMVPQRADILPAGILILKTVLSLLKHNEAKVSPTDLLFGYLLLQREREHIPV